jgi:hypothetical protein
MTVAEVTARRTAWFPSMAMMVRWRGPGGGDGRADDVVPGRSGDGGGGGRRGGGVVLGAAVKVEEERDGLVLGCGGEGRADDSDGVEVIGVAAASKRAQEILAA